MAANTITNSNLKNNSSNSAGSRNWDNSVAMDIAETFYLCLQVTISANLVKDLLTSMNEASSFLKVNKKNHLSKINDLISQGDDAVCKIDFQVIARSIDCN